MNAPACCKTKHATDALKKNAAFLRTIGDANRLRILCRLQERELCVCEIWQHLDLSQNLTSHHLSVLKELNLIHARKDGLKVFYSINQNVMTRYFHFLTHILWRTKQS